VREINVSRARDPVRAGDKALTRETPAKRGRVNRYVYYVIISYRFLLMFMCTTHKSCVDDDVTLRKVWIVNKQKKHRGFICKY
jgi:hypothetical protein